MPNITGYCHANYLNMDGRLTNSNNLKKKTTNNGNRNTHSVLIDGDILHYTT